MTKELIAWKGTTITELQSFIKKNEPILSDSIGAKFRARPLKIYRQEIVHDTTQCNGISTIIEVNHGPESCDVSCILSDSEKAKRRVRSSGMLPNKHNNQYNNDRFHTTTKEYLTSRNKTFQQNQFNYLIKGNAAAAPGSQQAASNVYVSQGNNKCKKYHIITEQIFEYKWIDDSINTVTIPVGYYNIIDLNNILQRTMYTNYHYLIKKPTQRFINYLVHESAHFLLEITWADRLNKLEIQSFNYSPTLFPNNKYTIPTRSDNVPHWAAPPTSTFPYVIIKSDSNEANQKDIANILGFNIADGSNVTYPESPDTNLTVVTTLSNKTPLVYPGNTLVYYKPNNHKFATQGAVSSGDLITRKKFNSINTTANTYRGAYGDSVANSMAYGVPNNGHTIKNKLGYPIPKVPKVINGVLTECLVYKI